MKVMKKRSFGIMSFNAIEDVNYLIMTNLKMGKDRDCEYISRIKE